MSSEATASPDTNVQFPYRGDYLIPGKASSSLCIEKRS